MTARTLEQAWTKPHWEVLCVIGTVDGVQQVARLEHRGRIEWRDRRTAERHAASYRAAHGRDAYTSEC